MKDATGRSVQGTAEKLATDLVEGFFSDGRYLRENVAELASRALFGDETELPAANAAIFAVLAERLSDSFNPKAVTLYNRVFSQLIQFCRAREWELDVRLDRFRLANEDDLIARAESLRQIVPIDQLLAGAPKDSVKLIILLSRVTVGADVAITSVIAQRLKTEFPNAEILIGGSPKIEELLGGDSRLRFRQTRYSRSGSLISRLLSWSELLGWVGRELDQAAAGRALVVDPDSRLTQLGLLPATETSVLFFPSRDYGSSRDDSLGQLTSDWLDDVCGSRLPCLPALSLARIDARMGGELVRRLRKSGAKSVVCVNLGVGDNHAKRVGEEFEKSLLDALLGEGVTLILDRGAGDEEERRAGALINNLRRNRDLEIIDVDESNLSATLRSEVIAAKVVVWRGRIGLLAAMIRESDLYVGYDSAGQHIAAALGVPCIDVFAGYSSRRMLDRWKPAGRADVFLIDAGATGNAEGVLDEAMRCVRLVLNRTR